MLAKLAHVKWFTDVNGVQMIDSLSSLEWAVVAISIVAGIGLMLIVDKFFHPIDKKLDISFKKYRPYVPTVVRLSTAALIIFNFWSNYLLAPNIRFHDNTLFLIINILLILVAVMLIFGSFVRVAGFLLITLYLTSLLVAVEAIEILDHLEYLGLGLYLLFAGAGAWSVASLSDPLAGLESKKYLATPLLKTFAGVGLIVVAFSEKLLDMSLSNEFLLHHDWNMLSGFGMSDRNFIIMAAIIEILLGLTLILNKASRLGTLALLLTMTLTAIILGIDEVFGHMFALSVVASVWIGPNENLFKKRSS